MFLIQRCWDKKQEFDADGGVDKPARAGRGEEIIDSADLPLTIISVETRLARLVGLETVTFDDTSCHDLLGEHGLVVVKSPDLKTLGRGFKPALGALGESV